MKTLLTLLFLLTAFLSNAQNNLDKITGLSSTTASVAYSLRQLSNGYTGPLVRIKVGSSFYDVYPDVSTTKFSLSSKISAAIVNYNDGVSAASTNALSTIISGSTDATVAIWYDQSGNAVHVLSNTSTAKIVTAGSINTIFGQPTVYFSGSNGESLLTSANTVNYSALSGATVNAVAQNIATTSSFAGIIGAAYALPNPGYNIAYDATIGRGYASDGAGCTYGTSLSSTTPQIITNIFTNTTTNLSNTYINGVLKTNSGSQCNLTHTSGSKIYIGSARGYGPASFIGNISEAIIFPSQLSDAIRNPLETNQSQTYFGPAVTIASSASGAVCAGNSVTFTATVSGISSPTYQWTKNGIAIPGANASTYSSTSLSNNDVIKVWVNAGINQSSIVSNGLLLNIDASNPGSYAGTGNNWYDLSGNNNHATLMNSPTYDAASGSIVTNGTNQYISIPLFNNSITDVTMQTWVYINTPSKGVFIANGYGNGYSIGIGDYFESNGSIATMLFSNKRWVPTNVNYTVGWHLVTMVLDGSSTPSFYIDNTFKYSSSGTAPQSPSGSLTLGAIPGDQGRYYAGKFAAAYFYNRALSLSEIQQNYNAFATKTTGYGSNSISVSISGSTPILTISGDACVNKTTLSTTSGLTAYAWYKDDVVILGATSNTYTPTASGSFKVQVTSGSCSSSSSATNITNCSVASDGSMKSISNSNSIISPEGGANFGTGRDYSGKLYNTIGLTTTSGTIGSSTAVLGGIISPTNSVTNSIGVIYSTDINFGTYSSTTIQSNVAAGTYTSTISGLTSTTNYFTKSFIVNKAGTNYGPVLSFTTTSPPVALGGQSQGGTVAYIYKSGDPGYVAGETHGIIMSNSFVNPTSSTKWSAETNPIATNATGTALGTGLTNSNTIYTAIGNNAIAVNLCRNYSVVSNGVTYTNWYLPSINEWSKIIATRSAGSLPSFDYRSDATFTNVVNVWTSSEVSASDVIMINIGNGGYFNVTKTLNINDYGYIRAIRYF